MNEIYFVQFVNGNNSTLGFDPWQYSSIIIDLILIHLYASLFFFFLCRYFVSGSEFISASIQIQNFRPVVLNGTPPLPFNTSRDQILFFYHFSPSIFLTFFNFSFLIFIYFHKLIWLFSKILKNVLILDLGFKNLYFNFWHKNIYFLFAFSIIFLIKC